LYEFCEEIVQERKNQRIKSAFGGFPFVTIAVDWYFFQGGIRMSSNLRLGLYSRLFLNFVVLPLLFIAGVQLFILSAQTETYFAWTIPLPLTAAFMGAGYWAALAHAFVTTTQTGWERFRVALPAAFTATTLLLIATLLHLDQFHLDSPAFITRFVSWVWVIVYVVTPPIFLYLLVAKFPKTESSRANQTPFPGWVRGGFFLLAAFGLFFGLGLFFLPGSFMPLWPWKLAPLASRAVGAWLTTFGVASGTLAWINDRFSGLGTLASLLTFCILQFVVLFRYLGSVNFANPLAWGYVLFLLLGLGASGAALLRSNSVTAVR